MNDADRADPARCLKCDESLPDDRRVYCVLCTRAATIAIEEADSRTVRPSDIDAVRRRLEQDAAS